MAKKPKAPKAPEPVVQPMPRKGDDGPITDEQIAEYKRKEGPA